MPEGNPLVAGQSQDGAGSEASGDNPDHGWAAGIGIAESAIATFNGVKDGNWVEGGLGVVGLVAEGAAAAIDPFGWLLSSVASFLMEHVQPLKDMLDSVCGDPPVISSYSETWGNVAAHLEESQVTFANAVKNGTSGWNGPAADRYRESCAEQEEALAGAATTASTISTVVMIFGEVVAFVRETVRDLIADLVGKLISWVLETVFSLGFGTPVVVAQAVTAISKWATKIADLLKKLTDTIRSVSPLLGKMADIFGAVMKVCGKALGKVTGLDAISSKNVIDGGFLRRVDGSGGGPGLGGNSSGSGSDGGGSDGSGSNNGSDGGGSDGSGSNSGGDGGSSSNTDSSGDSNSSGGGDSGSGGPSSGSTSDVDSTTTGTPSSSSRPDSNPSADSSSASSTTDGATSPGDGSPASGSPSSNTGDSPSPLRSDTPSTMGADGTTSASGRPTGDYDSTSTPPSPPSSANPSSGAPSGDGPPSAHSAPNGSPQQTPDTGGTGGGPSASSDSPNGTYQNDPGQHASSQESPSQNAPSQNAPSQGAPASHGPEPGPAQQPSPATGTPTHQSPSSDGSPSNASPSPSGPNATQPDSGAPRPNSGSHSDSTTASGLSSPSSSSSPPSSSPMPRGDSSGFSPPPQRGPDVAPASPGQAPQQAAPAGPSAAPQQSGPGGGPSGTSPSGGQSNPRGWTGTPGTSGARSDVPTPRPGPDGPGHRTPTQPQSHTPTGAPRQAPPGTGGSPHAAPSPQGYAAPAAPRGYTRGPNPVDTSAPHTRPPGQGPGLHGPAPQGQRSGPQGAGPNPHPGSPSPHARPDAGGPRRDGGPDSDHPREHRPDRDPQEQRRDEPNERDDRPQDRDHDRPHDRDDELVERERPDRDDADGRPDERLSPDEVNQRHAEPTPAGTSFHRGDSEMGDLPQRVKPDPEGRHTVDVHVTPDGHARIGDRTYTPEEFADILRRNGDYDGGPIRLVGCDASSNDFAQRLSRELDAEVLAPNKPAWTDSNGNVFTSDVEIGPDGKPRPKIPPNGEWSTHSPDGSTSRAGEDGFTPDTANSAKSDVDADSAEARGSRRRPFDVNDWNDYEIPRSDPRFGRRVVDWPIPDDSRFGRPHTGTSTSQSGNGHDSAPSSSGDEGTPPQRNEEPAGSDTATAEDRSRSDTDSDSGSSASERENGFRREETTKADWEDLKRVYRPVDDAHYREPEGVPRELADRVGDDGRLRPDTAYPVEYSVDGHRYADSVYYTDRNGDIKWVDLTAGGGPHPGNPSKPAPPNPAFDYPLQAEATYRVQNTKNEEKFWTFQTDERGFPNGMTGQPEIDDKSLPKKLYRDDQGDYGGQSRAKLEGIEAYKNDPDYREVWWAGGHYGAKEFGGPPEWGNMHPQMYASNSGSSYDGWTTEDTWRRAFEEDLARFERSTGGKVELIQVDSPRRELDGLAESDIARWRVTMPGADGQPVTREFERVFPVVPENVYPRGTNVKHYDRGPQAPQSDR